MNETIITQNNRPLTDIIIGRETFEKLRDFLEVNTCGVKLIYDPTKDRDGLYFIATNWK